MKKKDRLLLEAIVSAARPRTNGELDFFHFVRANREMGYGRMQQIISGVWYEQVMDEREIPMEVAAKEARLVGLDFPEGKT